jgi:putative GTP pyrophosphokinase
MTPPHAPLTDVSQRLKKTPTIVDKLVREPTLQLGNMQDIAGCRAVVADIDQLWRVERRITRNRPPIAVSDDVQSPRASGYRGVHLIVEYDGRRTTDDGRRIEIQLRTPVMHEWAITVERLGGLIQEDLKSGVGPPPVLALFGAVSEAMALEERGERVDDALSAHIDQLRGEARPWLQGNA